VRWAKEGLAREIENGRAEAALEIFERLGADASAAETLRRSLEWRGRGESAPASRTRDV
jgi:hypothetical protein